MSKHIDTRKVVRFMMDETFKQKGIFWCLFLVPFSSMILFTVLPYISSQILAELANNGGGFAWQRYIAFFAIAAVVGVIANRIGFKALLVNQVSALDRIHNKVVAGLLQKSSRFFADNMSGKIVSDGINISGAFIQFQDLLVIAIIPFVINVGIGITIVSLRSWQLGLGLLAMATIAIGSAVFASIKRKHLRVLRQQALRNLNGDFADIISNNATVKFFAREQFERERQKKLSAILMKHRVHDWGLVARNGSNRIIGLLTTQVAVMILIIMSIRDNPGNLATGIFALTFTMTMTNKLFDISTIIRSFEGSITDASPMIEILSEEPEIQDIKDAPKLKVSNGAVSFDNVTFQYSDDRSTKKLLSDFSLDIPAGQKIGLVGHSGGGKTTITKLILRLMDIQGGSISIDGQNIAEITQESLRQSIAYVPQEPLLFHRTVAQNISYGMPGATQEQIEQSAKLAYAHDFIKTLPDGYDTIVGERGVKLSGGQRQRIAIARAILKDAPILVLDEATSALDSESELLIQKALHKLMKTKTSIVIAHRLSTVQKMDRIVVVDDGKISEEGSHADLLKKDGVYAKLWAHQSGGFIE